MNRLVYESEGKQVEIRLSNRPVSLGRSDESDHKLPTKMASRIHAQVFPRDRGWWVEDLASSNGTIVNGNRIQKPMPLVPGDVIAIGDVKITYEGEAAQPQASPDHLTARIVYTPEKGKPAVDTLIRDRITIGRKPDNTLQIDLKVVSGQHCEILNRQGAYVFRDLGSSNGSFIGDKRVTEHTLRNGDVIVLGKKVPLYFVDPAGATEAPAPAPAAKPAPVKAGMPEITPEHLPPRQVSKPGSSAANASDRGVFKPVGDAKPKASVNPIPHIAVGLGLGGLFLLAGWLLGSVIGGLKNRPVDTPNERTPEAALADSAMSFEGVIDDGGNPEGWTASFEGKGGKAELLADATDPFDGERSLSVRATGVAGPGTLVLQTKQARELDLGGGFQLTMAMKGEGVSKIAVALSSIDETGAVMTLASGSFVGIKGTQWGQFSMTGTTLTPAPKNAQLRLLVAGSFSHLWLDRIELAKTAEPGSIYPFEKLDAPNLTLGFDSKRQAQAVATNTGGKRVRFQPVLLSMSDSRLSEPELWSVNKIQPDSVSYSTMLASMGDAAAVQFKAAGHDNGYFTDNGLRLDWDMRQGGGSTLAVDVMLPLPPGATIGIADRRGYPMVLDREQIHAYAYATISELMVNETGLSVSFPRGAVVWFDMSRPGELVATVRAARDTERKTMQIDVNTRPLMFARLYDRLYDEAMRLMDTQYYSAAEVRLRYLTSNNRADADLPVLRRAGEKLKEIAAHRVELSARVESAWEKATDQRSKPTLQAAEGLVRQYIAEFPGDDVIDTMNDRLSQIDTWLAEIALQARTPAELQAAEITAKSLYSAADQSFKQGNILLALVMLETIFKDFSDTSQYHNAQALHREIEEQLDDPAEQNRVIDEELKGIDEDIKFKDYERGRNRCLALFKRFPTTERTRDIMKRLRAIEDAFEG